MINYTEAGVNIEEGYKAVTKYRGFAASTATDAVLNGIGGFAGMFSLKEFRGMEEPVLISGTDGVGTKLDIALRMKKYEGAGIDCVAMCVNDILCQGARPLFFLDYISCGKLDSNVTAGLVKGVAWGCRETGMALLGGETAEHPGIMDEGEYDIAGFAVGIADRKKIIDGQKIREGGILLGVASSGVHSNGFSLIRKVIPDMNENFGGMPIGLALLEPTRLYVKPVLELMNTVEILGMAHITGGGFYENVPRLFHGKELTALINDPLKSSYKGGWQVPPVFARIAYGVKENGSLTGGQAQKAGGEILRTDEEIKKTMFNTYNMGIGLVLALRPADAQKAAAFLEQKGFPAWEIGRVEKGESNTAGIRFV